MIYTHNKIWWQDHEQFLWSWDMRGPKKMSLGFPALEMPLYNGLPVSVGRAHIRIGDKPVFKYRDRYLERTFGWPIADTPKFITIYQDLILYLQGHKSRVFCPELGALYSLNFAIVHTPKGVYKLGNNNKFTKFNFNQVTEYFNLKKIGMVHV